MVMLSQEMKKEINESVMFDCKQNGAKIVAERMRVCDWEILLPKAILVSPRVFATENILVENFTGDSYDVQQRKAELQKIVAPIGRIKYFSAHEVNKAEKIASGAKPW